MYIWVFLQISNNVSGSENWWWVWIIYSQILTNSWNLKSSWVGKIDDIFEKNVSRIQKNYRIWKKCMLIFEKCMMFEFPLNETRKKWKKKQNKKSKENTK